MKTIKIKINTNKDDDMLKAFILYQLKMLNIKKEDIEIKNE